ncbi:MAG TPA: transglycosylase SLT domain-containing protein [Candidatus Binataceae bacterium]|nr:transglycosylase SLT domain-containing protein [Candidatus Binataceae bacterium]
MGWTLRLLALMLALLMPCAAAAQSSPAAIVEVPLTVDYATLSEAMKQQLFVPNGRALLWKGLGECEYLYAEHPILSKNGAMVRLETDGHLGIGLKMGGNCVNPIVWNGIIQAESEPYVAGHMLKLRITDLNLLNAQHRKTLIVGRGFDLVKRYFIPRLETFEFDLNPATDQLKQLALAASPPDVARRVSATLATLRVLPEIAVREDGIRARIELTLPPMPTPGPAAAAPVELTSQEIAAFETQLDQWDAFLVFAIKQLGGVNKDPQFRNDLLALLLDSRARLVAALENPRSAGPDPVRLLFLDVWHQLGEIVRAAARRGTLGDRSLQFLEFVSAGDALFALDQAAPALGMRVSADDLRRLAHIMAPQSTADPLAFTFAEDPELQKLFAVKPPIESEGPLEAEPLEAPAPAPTAAPTAPASGSPAPAATESSTPTSSAHPTASATPSETATPRESPSTQPTATASPPVDHTSTATASPTAASPDATPAPRATMSPPPSPSAAAGSELEFVRWLLGPSSAYGSEGEPGADKPEAMAHRLQTLGKRLRRVVVNGDNAQQYHNDMEQLIELSGLTEYADQGVDAHDRTIYLALVKAVAWQESCWRQFVRKNRRVVYLESSTHDIGLMQVNRYVWRGFYSVPRLEWDILYNSSAGMEILARLLEQIKDKPGATSRGKPGDLARSVYAAYNGGPSAYRRWRGHESRDSAYVDLSFWLKYRALTRGQTIDILSCAAQWGSAPGH